MSNKKTSKLAVRLEPREKKLLNYYATRLGVSSSSLVRNQIKVLLNDLEEKIQDNHIANITKVTSLAGPTYTQEEIENMFEVK